MVGEKATRKDPAKEGAGRVNQVQESTPFILGESLPVVPAKLVKKILRGDFVDMADLLEDNLEAERRR